MFSRREILASGVAAPLIPHVGTSGDVTIFRARSIVTMDPSLPFAKFMAVANGQILALGQSAQDVATPLKHRTLRYDNSFADHVLFPGLIDPHVHPMQAAVMLNLPFLAPDAWSLPSGNWPALQTPDAYRSALRQLAARDKSDPLICWGHHELFHGPITKTDLDAVSPDRALIVWQRSFHEIIANSAALRMMKLDEEGAFHAAIKAGGGAPEHGDFARGIFSETALLVALDRLRPILLSKERMVRGFRDLQTIMGRRGVTTVSDMATGIFARFSVEAGLIKTFFDNDAAMARVMLMPMASELDNAPDIAAWMDQARAFTSSKVMLSRRVKLLSDGAFFAQNMQMGAPGYLDGHVGKWLTEPDKLADQLHRYWDAGFSLHIHVNGDEATGQLLDSVAQLAPRRSQNIIFEHLGFCTAAQVERIAELGIYVSAQPNYIRVLGGVYAQNGLGPDRAALINRLGSLARKNIPLALHSDYNMAPLDPFYLAWIAETREGLDGIVRAPEERLSRHQALRAVTTDAARVIGLDNIVGSLASGKKADFIVLDHDPHNVKSDVLANMPILKTVFEGRYS